MTSTTACKIKPALGISAFGFELRLWQGASEAEWNATIENGKQVFHYQFEEGNLMLAKLHLLEQARARGMYCSKDKSFPTCVSLVDMWHEAVMVTPEG